MSFKNLKNKNNLKTLLFLLQQGVIADVPIPKNNYIVEYGEPSTYTNGDILSMFGIYVFNDNGTIKADGTGTHLLQKLVYMIETGFAQLRSLDVGTYLVGDTSTVAMGFMNLGRLARQVMSGEDRINTYAKAASELARNISGTVCGTHSVTDVLTCLYFAMGSDLKQYVGDWNKIKYRPEEEIAAGLWIALHYVLFFTTPHFMTLRKLHSLIGTYSLIDGIYRGSYVQFNRDRPETWGSVLLADENLKLNEDYDGFETATGKATFGMTQSILDDPSTRALTIPIYTTAVTYWQRLLSKSEWSWRHGKYTNVQPLYFMFNPETDSDGAVLNDFDAAFTVANLTGSYQWTHFLKQLNDLVNDFTSFMWKSPVMGKLKSTLKQVKFSDVPVPSATGPGGLFMHQLTHYVENASTDTCQIKFGVDTDDTGHGTIMPRRDVNNINVFQIYGDVELRDYQIMVAMTAKKYAHIDGASPTAINSTYVKPLLEIKNYFAFAITKSEHIGYQLDVHQYQLVSPALAVSLLVDNFPIHVPKEWTKTVTSSSRDVNWPVSLQCSEGAYWHGRTADPYKKIAHTLYSVNYLDVDFLTDVMCSTIFGASLSSVPSSATPIIVSAIPGAEGSGLPVVAASTGTPEIKTDTVPVVSAIPKEKEDKKEDKKEEKK